ncbi:hypothetical protein GMLC_19370 [Geomonas limicola]|uniref:histidine kinase n=1 Tax=Geomonas limicola TaxID=2740186 RepID=A0A6V8N714_9BACT|nr:ATP-binding protein [Geomonas limicola]GFO68358.1 hypothetical protein GMLC_19370 [Geomonas limicola]
MNDIPSRLSAQLMAVDIISELLVSSAPHTLGEQFTAQLRELTGARTAILVVHDASTGRNEILSVSPERRSGIIAADEVTALCAAATQRSHPLVVAELPDDHPSKSALLHNGVTDVAPYPLIVGCEAVGTLLLLNLPGLDRIEETDDIIHLLAPPIALALKNSLAFRQIERQANELEHQVEVRTAQLMQKNAELQRLENLHRAIVLSAMEGFCLVDATLKIVDVNEAYCTMSGYLRGELIGTQIAQLDAIDSPDDVAARARRLMETGSDRFESQHRRKDGSLFPVEVSVSCVPVEDLLLSVFIRDISDRKLAEEALRRSEEQLRQSQKMEAIGQLAGGVAHDFNNILQVIEGYCSLLQVDRLLTQEQRQKIDQIATSADKAAQLTRGLLTFSRKQALLMKHEDLNDIVKHVHQLLVRVIGEDINLTVSCCAAKLPIVADRGQMEQVLINLATNARDAMSGGGVFTVQSERIILEDSFSGTHGYDIPPGAYARLTVSDTGCGIKKEHLERVFEPFFTTKQVGKGTGLGMAITYGIIKQHNGLITVYSEQGQGTIFRIYLPIDEMAVQPVVKKEVAQPVGGQETILVAEDDPFVRSLVSSVLTSYGYQTILAADGQEAIERYQENQGEISLILMDVIMPNKNGREAFEEIQRIRPGAKALFTSGYTADFIQKRGVSEEGIELIMKPVQPMDLLRKVREMLDG